jgi:hypothetical protein
LRKDFYSGDAETKILKVHREAFITLCWRAFLVEKDDKFNESGGSFEEEES